MRANENSRGSKNRIMILMYITLLTLSLAPAMVAPPERGFVQGQPEMQQAMDNMVTRKPVISKRMAVASKDDADYHAMLSSKTSSLLAEAEKVLNSLPNSKERQWIESFVQRMRAIAAMLEKTAQIRNLPKNPNTENGTPVPEGLPLQPTWPATFAVPGINPFQKMNRMMSKYPVTSPELSKVLPANEYPSERQTVTKPAVLTGKKDDEEDELVRELESLHQEYSQQELLQNSKVLDQTPVLTTPSTPMSVESSKSKPIDTEIIKAKLQAKLLQEIADFQLLGGVMPNEVINALHHTNNQKAPGLENIQKTNLEDNLKYTEAGMIDKQGLIKLNDLNNEDKEISKTNLENPGLEENNPYQGDKQLLHMKANQTFQHILPNFHPTLHAYPKQIGNFNYMASENKFPHQGFQNGNQGLKNPNPYNQGNYHGIIGPQQLNHLPDALKQMWYKPQKNFNRHMPFAFHDHLMRHNYGPHSYSHNWDPKNSTLHMPPMLLPHQSKELINHQIDTQLSDEMKRQLRDGKIIVLSDSVVRSNFETNNGENIPKSTSEEPENNKKNVTET